ncbi:prefoldin subunit beta [Candidatus Woesearchaeota archaeon]|nr:prefoldin subunit beta [Candidatus Woesearchaeota archaeon]
MDEETKEKITQLQNLEQNINGLIAQKQQFQSQDLEIDNALSQLDSGDKVFRIIGNIMVSSKKDKVRQELNEKKEIIGLRLKSFDKQEEKLRDKAAEIQQEVMKEMKKE